MLSESSHDIWALKQVIMALYIMILDYMRNPKIVNINCQNYRTTNDVK